ncbi:MAG: BON domain-containing protein [Acidobacteria bacterium]|nr:BON domain-containing protein [Acidobacteriota bacterium]
MVRRFVVFAVFISALSWTAVAAEKPPHKDSKTLTGCLNRSERGFLLNDGKHNVELTGELDFQEYLGHTVKLTGVRTGWTFEAKALEDVADQCNGVDLSKADPPKDRRDKSLLKPPDDGPTAQDQGSDKSDRETAAAIRRALVADESLSTYAHNVKIIARDGRVVLRGPVRSAEEKLTVMTTAEAIVGAGGVEDRMTVEPGSGSKSDR